MTTKEKARAYDEAIRKAAALYKASEPMSGCNVIIETLFPELKESEDEKIRKTLIEYFNAYPKDYYGELKKSHILAWLEKQGEQEKDILEDAILDGNEDGLIAETIRYKHENQGRQNHTQEIEPFEAEHGKYYYCIKDYFCGGRKQASKGDVIQALRGLPIMGLKDASEYFLPVNFIKCNSAWGEEDEHRIKDTVYFLDTAKKHYASTEELDACIDWIQSLKDRVQLKQEWNEEDEIDKEILNAAILFAMNSTDEFACNGVSKEDVIDWLKSLKDRVQPKQEWSEEDKYMYDILCGTIENTDINENTKYKLISWLKSLRPQNKWKPTELQLGCLSDAIEYYNSFGYPVPKLKELLDDLKKLKEE